jgi:alanine-glyoxylate transaminase/serine-glyoxylate transaminase/serine-pyruvate transaminase
MSASRPVPASAAAGRHFLQIPGPTNVPDRVLRAMARPVIDHRGPEFATLGRSVLERLKPIFRTKGHVVLFSGSGTGAWEAALVNTLAPGDRVLMVETGQFAVLWRDMASKFGLKVDNIATDWRHGVDANAIERKLKEDSRHEIKAVCVVHNETSTGAASRIGDVRAAMDSVRHPALLLIDAVSSLGSIDVRHDEWGVDVTVSCSQKGLMLPPGIGLNAISDKALAAAKAGGSRRAYWDWQPMLKANADGFFANTPATNLLYALDEALAMFEEEGIDNVYARHDRLAEATRRAVAGWGLENLCLEPKHYSSILTAVLMPDGHNADAFRKLILERFNMSLGMGLGKIAGKVFRIGHIGEMNDLTLAGTLAGVEMALGMAGVPHQRGGVDAALRYLAETSRPSA